MTNIQDDDAITPYLRHNITPGLSSQELSDHIFNDFVYAPVKPALIVIDTLGAFMPIADFNDYAQARSAMDPLIRMVHLVGQHQGTATLFLHHARKGEGEGSEAVLGSTMFSGIVDTIIRLSNSQAPTRRKLRIQGRHGTGALPEECEIAFEDGVYRMASTSDELKEELLSVVEAGASTPSAIQEALADNGVSMGKTTRSQLLGGLVDDGRIIREGKGRTTSYGPSRN